MPDRSARLGRLVLLAALAASAAGCYREGIYLREPRLTAPRQVPTLAVVRPAGLTRQDFALDGRSGRYQPMSGPMRISWVYEDRFGALCEEYFARSQLFQAVSTELPYDRSEMYLVLQPRVVLNQYVKPSLTGTLLTVGTGLLYNILGGSNMDRYVECELTVDARSPTGRHLATYFSSCQSPEKLVTEAPDKLGPLVGDAFTRALDDVAAQLAADNDLLMLALSADLAAKGVVLPGPERINVRSPKSAVVRSRNVHLVGQVTGVDRPARLLWSLNGDPGGEVPLKDTSTHSVKDFDLGVLLEKGVARIGLRLQGQVSGTDSAPTLAYAEVPFVCATPGEEPDVGNRWAVVIGISKYAHKGSRFDDLQFAHRDAAAFRDFLLGPRSGGFPPDHVLCLTDEQATFAEIRRALFEFLARAERNDLVLIFFSGHGMAQPGADNLFLLCHDTEPDHLPSTSFPMWDIDTALTRYIRAERVVVFVDACHSGGVSLGPGVKGTLASPVFQYLQRLALSDKCRLVLSASEARERSHESKEFGAGHGVFTHFLLRGLNGEADKDGDRLVTAGEIVDYVRARVTEATKDAQHPDQAGPYDRQLPLAIIPPDK